MVRIEAIERAIPRDWRRIICEHPWLSLAVGATAGAYLGRNHSRLLLSAVTTAGIAVVSQKWRELTGTDAR